MSRLSIFSKVPENQETTNTIKGTPMVESHHILLEAVPIPVGTNEFDPEKVKYQSNMLNQFRTSAKDMFDANECRCVLNAGQRLYQTEETYGTSMTVEQMVEIMKKADLTMRVNFRRPGVHSSTTCMELSASLLQKLLQETEDNKSQKTLELRVKAEAHVAVPKHGAMFISVTKKGPVHLLTHIDYKIMSSYDKMYHSN